MKILMISNLDDDEKLEDIWIARAFQKDGHQVAFVDASYDERLEDIFDIFLRRNTWSSTPTEKEVGKSYTFAERIRKKNLARINFDGKFDGRGKRYLVNLFNQGYSVIPTVENLNDCEKLGKCPQYLLKLKDSYDGIGQIKVTKQELAEKFDNRYIIQPFMEFKSEVQFYYIKDRLEYALEFKPSKVPVYPEPIKYSYTQKEEELANSFAKLNGEYFGIQRIDFIKLEDGTLLLTEIEDIAPYLDLDCVDEDTRKHFLKEYTQMVYEYMKKYEDVKNIKEEK